MRQPWNRVVAVEERRGERGPGLEYHFPCCGKTVFVSREQLATYLGAAHDIAVDPAPGLCDTCPKTDPEIETDQVPSNVIAFKANQ